MKKKLEDKLKTLPKSPGVYFHKDTAGEIIYVGKASNLKNRVASYFQESRTRDFKTGVMVAEIADVDWLEVGSEVEALFLESALIKRYQPKFNILLRDDKNFLYVKISDDEYPVVSYVRRPLDDKAEYFGPYIGGFALRKAMKQLRRSFPYVTHAKLPGRACLHHHIGLCPGPEVGAVTTKEYRQNLRQIKRYLRGQGGAVMRELEKSMNKLAKAKDYEGAARVRDQLSNLKSLSRQHLFGDKELFDLSRDQALIGLKQLLNLSDIPRRIEAYDISHLQGTNNVASMVVFNDGVPNRGEYRKFKMRTPGNDDFAHMREVMARRLKYLDKWPHPDVILIDGGKGQVNAALSALSEVEVIIPVIGLAKRHEDIIIPTNKPKLQGQSLHGTGEFEVVSLDKGSHLLKLLRHIRDEAHRFAITYHTNLRSRAQVASILEQVPGVGPATRKKLIRAFGSYRGVKAASKEDLSAVVGDKTARLIQEYISSTGSGN